MSRMWLWQQGIPCTAIIIIMHIRIPIRMHIRMHTRIRIRIIIIIIIWLPAEGCQWICMCRRDFPTIGKYCTMMRGGRGTGRLSHIHRETHRTPHTCRETGRFSQADPHRDRENADAGRCKGAEERRRNSYTHRETLSYTHRETHTHRKTRSQTVTGVALLPCALFRGRYPSQIVLPMAPRSICT